MTFVWEREREGEKEREREGEYVWICVCVCVCVCVLGSGYKAAKNFQMAIQRKWNEIHPKKWELDWLNGKEIESNIKTKMDIIDIGYHK